MLTVLKAQLQVIVKSLPDEGDLGAIKAELNVAIARCDDYNQKWDSIRWVSSTKRVKREVRADLIVIASGIYANLCKAAKIAQKMEVENQAFPLGYTSAFLRAYFDFCEQEGDYLTQIPEDHRKLGYISRLRLAFANY